MNAIKSINGSTIVFNKMPRIECEDITIKVGETLELFDYLVAYDEDNNQVDKEKVIISKTNLDTSKAGKYELVVEVNDKTNTYRVQHTINIKVKTNNKPVIIGASNIEIPINEIFDPMYGVIATDTEDGVITNKIIINGFFNVCKVGRYILTYSVTDSDNNTTVVDREINVIEKEVQISNFQDDSIKNNEEVDITTEVENKVKNEAIEPIENRLVEDTLILENIHDLNETLEYKEVMEVKEDKNDNKKPKKLKKRKKVRKKRKKEKPKKLSRKEKKQLKRDEKQKRKEDKLREKEEKKALKEEYKKVDRYTADILPFLEIAKDDTFKTKNGYIDIFQIETKDLNSLNYSEANRHKFDFSNFLRHYIDDMKIISMTFPVNTQIQQQNILKKIDNTDNDVHRKFLYKRLEQLIAIEEKRKNREFYLMLFYEDEKTKREREFQLLRLTSSAIKLSPLDLDKKLRIIFKLNNQNSKI